LNALLPVRGTRATATLLTTDAVIVTAGSLLPLNPLDGPAAYEKVTLATPSGTTPLTIADV
jgi:hypothetical protein